MKRRNLYLVMVLVLALILTACGSKEEVPNYLDEKHEVIVLPDFKLGNLEGKEVSSDILEENDINIIALWQST